MSDKKQSNSCADAQISVKKANEIIHAISSASLFANKIMLYALLKAKERVGCEPFEREYYDHLKKMTFTDFSEGLVATMSVPELKKILGDSSGSFYTRLTELMDISSENSLLSQYRLIINDNGSGLSGCVNIIQATIYDREVGKLFIKFTNESEIKKRVVDIKRNYTPLDLATMMSFKSNASYRLYEMLMSLIGLEDYKGHEKGASYTFNFGISELRYRLGSIDTNSNPGLSYELTKATTPQDYEHIEKKYSANGKVSRYQVFDRTFSKAVREINELMQGTYEMSYQANRTGHGGKISDLTITVKCVGRSKAIAEKDIKIEEIYPNEAALDEDVCISIRDILKEPSLTDKDCMDIAEVAQYDLDAIQHVSEVIDASPTPIKNIVAFTKAALKNEFQIPIGRETAASSIVGYNKAHRDRQGIMHENIDYDKIVKQKILDNLLNP